MIDDLKQLRQRAAANPADHQLQIRLGELFYKRGDYEDARCAFEQAIDAKPDSPQAAGGLAGVLLMQGAYSDAKDLYEAAMAGGLEKSAENLTNLGTCYAFEGEHDAARKCMETALATNPNYEPVYGALARLCLDAGDYSATAHYASLGSTRFPKNVPCLETRGLARLATLDLVQAEADFDRAIGLDPAAVDALLGKASVLLAQGKTDAAIDVLASAKKAEPENAEVWLTLAGAHQIKGNLANAEACLATAAELEPLNWRVYQSFANLALARGECETGLGHVDMALQLGANAPVLHFLRGSFLASLNRLEEAKNEFESATHGNPLDALSFVSLAEVETLTPSEKAAPVEHARKALELSPTGPVADRAQRVLRSLGAA